MKRVSRRVFLTASAAVGAWAAAPRAVAANERITAAVIGCHNQGINLAEASLRTGLFQIAALCDCDEAMFGVIRQKLAEKKDPTVELAPSCKEVKDFRRLLDDKSIEAVIIATPDHSHALLTCWALEAGKHVYIEKPVSYNVADGKAMLAAHRKHPDLTVLVGTQQRSGRHFQEARDFVRSGGLGKVAFCRAFCVHERKALQAVPDSDPPATLDYDMWLGPAPYRPFNSMRVHYNWRFFRDYGTGEMGNWGAHWLDIILWYLDLGLPKSVAGLGGQFVTKDIKEWPDTQTVLYEYPELTVLWELRLWSKKAPGLVSGAAAELCGEKGSLYITRKGWTFYPNDGEPQEHEGSEQEQAHMRNFSESIRGIAQPIAPLEGAYLCATLCHYGNIAATVNRRLEVDAESWTIRNDEEARALESRPYRKPWVLPS